MYYIMIERNKSPYYLVHAGNDGEDRIWSTDIEEAIEFFDNDAALSICDKGTVVRIGDEEMEWNYDDTEDWM